MSVVCQECGSVIGPTETEWRSTAHGHTHLACAHPIDRKAGATHPERLRSRIARLRAEAALSDARRRGAGA